MKKAKKNTIVAFNISEARVFDKARAFMLCEKLNADKESLIANGYTEFEVVRIGLNSSNSLCLFCPVCLLSCSFVKLIHRLSVVHFGSKFFNKCPFLSMEF